MKRGEYSFKQWCIDNNKGWLIDWWRSDLNKCEPETVSFRSNAKYAFHCGDPKHPVVRVTLDAIVAHMKPSADTFCVGCKSVAKYIVNNYGEDYLNDIWSDKNNCSPYEISSGSTKKIWLKCLDNKYHPDYELAAYNVKNSINCPYCVGKKVCAENSLGNNYPEVFDVWSDKNQLTPYDYTTFSNQKIYLKCPAGKHKDSYRKICAHVRYGFRCGECSHESQIEHMFKGENNPRWNPDLSEDRRLRLSQEYSNWRVAVLRRDGYVCQCCLNKANNHLNVHHIYAFAYHKDIRTDLKNGITLCDKCHDMKIPGSLHNIYGTHDVSPETLEKYINDKRRTLGIDDEFFIKDYIGKIERLVS